MTLLIQFGSSHEWQNIHCMCMAKIVRKIIICIIYIYIYIYIYITGLGCMNGFELWARTEYYLNVDWESHVGLFSWWLMIAHSHSCLVITCVLFLFSKGTFSFGGYYYYYLIVWENLGVVTWRIYWIYKKLWF